MNTLHALFAQRDQQAFQRQLERARNVTSGPFDSGCGQGGGRSWTKSSPIQPKSHSYDFDVNARDWLGRTVLHLACSSYEASAPEYVRLLLAYPGINVNLQDLENLWTPLHKALYDGNIIIAVLLLERGDIDVTIRDAEGNTALDLYNSTVNYTKPSTVGARLHVADKRHTPTELYTWGANRNATLGLGDGNDRVHPERVQLYPTFRAKTSSQLPSSISQVGMSKLHTAIVTNDTTNNVRACGFGLGGRLGQTQHTQYDFISMQAPQKIVKVALGQDHTLALTDSGEVMSWGLNRFSQLGYVVESADLIQPTARKIAGPLRGKKINGIAACKTASVCWSVYELFAWGTNNGQFGWTKDYNPVLTNPKVVTKVDEPVANVALSDSAMVYLGTSGAVVCLWGGRSIRVPFQLPNTVFPHASNQYTQFARFATMTKLSTCDNVFGALSTDGELFIFTPPEPKVGPGGEKVAIKPQLVWALRKAFTAVKDFSMAADGSIILCTDSGHAFLRTRNPKAAQSGAKAFKFRRIPYIQRVATVYGNNTGAFAALRVDFAPDPIPLTGNLMNEDLADLLPFWHHRPTWSAPSATPEDTPVAGVDQEEEASSLGTDIHCMRGLCDFLFPVSLEDPKSRTPEGTYKAPGADVAIRVQKGSEVPAHRCILMARSPVLASLLSGQTRVVQDTSSNLVITVLSGLPEKRPRMAPLSITGCHAVSVLILLYYLYSDEVLAVWDPRISRDVVDRIRVHGKINPHEVRSELKTLARILELPLFETSLQAVTKLAPEQSTVQEFCGAFAAMQDPAGQEVYKPDVVLELADRRVHCHSTILRARSEFFAAFFDCEDWARNRWTPEGKVVVDLKHMKWRPMEFVLRFLCAGEDVEMFDSLDYVNSIEDLVNLMLEIIIVSNELLIDRLNLICSSIILRHIDLNNICTLYSEAVYYHLDELVTRFEAYIVVNMEALIAYRVLSVLPYDLLKRISSAVRMEQSNKAPVTRSSLFVDRAMEKYGNWLRLQDIPQPIARTQPIKDRSDVSRHRSIPDSPALMPTPRGVSEDIFPMDGVSSSPPVQLDSPTVKKLPSKQTPGWKQMGPIVKHNMKSIIAETERNAFPHTPPRDGSLTAKWTPRTPPRPELMPSSPVLPVSSSPGKRVDPRTTLAIMQGPPTIARPVTTGSGLSITRPQGVSPALGEAEPQSQTPPKTIVPKSPARIPTPLTRTQSNQVSQPTTPVKPSAGSPSVRRTSSGGKPWATTSSNPLIDRQPSQGRVISFAAIQWLQEEEKLPKGKQKQSLKEIQEEEQARVAEEEFLKWWAAEEERVRKEEEEALRVAISMTKGESRSGEGRKRQHGRGGRKGSRGKQQPERRHAALSTGQ